MALFLYKSKEAREKNREIEAIQKAEEDKRFKEEMEEMELKNRFRRVREIVFYDDYDKLLTMEEVEYWENIYGLR